MAACESPLVENPILIGTTLYPWKQMNQETPSILGDIFKDPIPTLFHHIPTSSSSQQQEEEEEEKCMEVQHDVDEKEEEEEKARKQYYYLPHRRIRKGTVFWRSRSLGGQFPPPISSISVSSGKPWVYFKSYRREGRFVLKKIIVPTLELLHASREDGRLRMNFIHRSEEKEQQKGQKGLLQEQHTDGALPSHEEHQFHFVK